MDELPLGYRFYPTEEELVSFYLRNKLQGRRPDLHRVIPDINFFDVEPWHLPKLSGVLCQKDTEQWFFFAPRQEREARGGRPNRSTATGYWKATGSPGYVYSSDNHVIGVKKTMVFYKGKAPTGKKTKWKMNEYRAIEEVAVSSGVAIPKLRSEFSLCRVYVVSGSFRAFDRRPLEDVAKETMLPAKDAVAPPAQNAQVVEKMSSPETSYSGGDNADFPGPAENIDWGLIHDLNPPSWDWEQLWP